MDLSGRVIVVAGGAGALGDAVVRALTDRGARPAILDRQLGAGSPAGVPALQVDAQDPRAVALALAEIEATAGPIDGLVNAIGRIHSAPLVNLLAAAERRALPVAEFDAAVADNLRPIFVVGAAVAERWLTARRPGVIVNLGSVAGRGNAGQSAYAAAKAGLHALTETWSRELGRFGIRVVTVAPGFIETATTRAAVPESVIERIRAETPLGRLGRPEEISHAVLFALENDFVTSTCISVDGGLVP